MHFWKTYFYHIISGTNHYSSTFLRWFCGCCACIFIEVKKEKKKKNVHTHECSACRFCIEIYFYKVIFKVISASERACTFLCPTLRSGHVTSLTNLWSHAQSLQPLSNSIDNSIKWYAISLISATKYLRFFQFPLKLPCFPVCFCGCAEKTFHLCVFIQQGHPLYPIVVARHWPPQALFCHPLYSFWLLKCTSVEVLWCSSNFSDASEVKFYPWNAIFIVNFNCIPYPSSTMAIFLCRSVVPGAGIKGRDK